MQAPFTDTDLQMLRAVLSPRQYDDLLTHKTFKVLGSDTRQSYTITCNHLVIVRGPDKNGQLRTMCAVPKGRFSKADHISALTLLIGSNEKVFLDVAAYKRE